MPLVQYFGVSLLGALTTTALLYADVAVTGALLRRRAAREVGLRRSDLRRQRLADLAMDDRCS